MVERPRPSEFKELLKRDPVFIGNLVNYQVAGVRGDIQLRKESWDSLRKRRNEIKHSDDPTEFIAAAEEELEQHAIPLGEYDVSLDEGKPLP